MRPLALALALGAVLAPQPAPAKGFFAIYTRDSARLVRWYATTFDLKPVRTERPDGTNLVVTILDGDLATIEIIGRPDLPPPSPASQRTGFFKTGFQVADLAPLLARWKDSNVTIAAGPFDDAQPAVRSVLLRDPDGNLVQVTQSLAG